MSNNNDVNTNGTGHAEDPAAGPVVQPAADTAGHGIIAVQAGDGVDADSANAAVGPAAQPAADTAADDSVVALADDTVTDNTARDGNIDTGDSAAGPVSQPGADATTSDPAVTTTNDAVTEDADGDDAVHDEGSDIEGIDYSALTLDIHGEPLTEDTPHGDFTNHMAYTMYCASGPSITIRLGRQVGMGPFIKQATFNVSKKLLVDASPAIRAAFRMNCQESRFQRIDVVDIEIKPLMRLILTLQAGGSITNTSGGLPRDDQEMETLAKAYIKAEYWQMDSAKEWLSASFQEQLATMRMWKDAARRVAQLAAAANNAPSPQYMACQERRIMDLARCYMVVHGAHHSSRIARPSDLVDFLLDFCPGVLLADHFGRFEQPLANHIASQLIRRYVQ